MAAQRGIEKVEFRHTPVVSDKPCGTSAAVKSDRLPRRQCQLVPTIPMPGE